MKTSFEYRALARESLLGRWNGLALLMFAYALVAAVAGYSSVVGSRMGIGWLTGFGGGVNMCLTILLVLPLGYAFNNICLLFVRSEAADDGLFGQLFGEMRANWRTLVCVGVLEMIILSLVGVLTLGIGLVILDLAYAFVPFVVHDNPDIDCREALRRSRIMMRGHKMDLFLLYLTFIPWILLIFITFGIAAFWVAPYVSMSLAHFYEDVKREYDTLNAGEYTPA